MTKCLVDIIVLTYNQVLYISKNLENLLSQKTRFGFKIIINDDCSSDGTIGVLRKYYENYPDIIDLQLNCSNLGILMNYYNALYRSSSKYICVCAGDDWWCDSNKLQKQVEILEESLEYNMVYSNYRVLIESKNVYHSIRLRAPATYQMLLRENTIPTLTTCFRRSILDDYFRVVEPNSKQWEMEDYPLWLWISKKARLAFIKDETSVYRVHQSSITHVDDYEKRIRFQNSVNDIRLFFGYLNGDNIKAVNDYNYLDLAHIAFTHGNYKEFREYSHKLSWRFMKNIIYKTMSLTLIILPPMQWVLKKASKVICK